jgi:hypothetical protein
MAGVLATALLASAPALAQQPQPKCDPSKGPQMIEGQVTRVDPGRSKITIRGKDGSTHEFEASKETLQDYKVGDTIEAKLRGC